MKEVKLLLVGIGGYGENYIKELLTNSLHDTKLVAVADPFISKSPYLDELVKREIPIFRTPEEFYAERRSADLVVISSPIHTHYSYIMCALDHQSNVLCEKPVSIDETLMENLIKKEKESNRFVAVGYQLCFSNPLQALKKDILDGLFGAPVRFKALRMMRRGDAYYQRNTWAGKLRCHGENVFDSPLSNACAHQLQTMLYLLGSSIETSCTVESAEGSLVKGRPTIENYDGASVCFHTKEQVDVYFYTAHCIDEQKVGPFGMFEFEKATILDQDDVFTACFKDGTLKNYGCELPEERLKKLHDAIECVRNGNRPPCTLVSSLAHTKAVLLAQDLPVRIASTAEKKLAKDEFYYAVPHLKETYLNAYEHWTLPAESV